MEDKLGTEDDWLEWALVASMSDSVAIFMCKFYSQHWFKFSTDTPFLITNKTIKKPFYPNKNKNKDQTKQKSSFHLIVDNCTIILWKQVSESTVTSPEK